VIVRDFILGQPHGTIRGTVRVPDGPPPRTAVVVVHGFKGYKDWAFFPWLAEQLAGDRHAVVTFNLSGSGIGDDPHAFTELEAFAANTFSREQADIGRVLDAVADDLLVRPPDRIGLLGHSRGGAGAILRAAQGGLDALVTWAAVADLDRWTPETRMEWKASGRIFVPNTRTGQQMPLDVGLLDDFEANRDRFDVTAAAGRVAVPWMVVHGTDDDTVDPEAGRILARAGPRAHLLLVEGAGHTFGAVHPFSGSGAALDAAVDATRRHFRRHLAPD